MKLEVCKKTNLLVGKKLSSSTFIQKNQPKFQNSSAQLKKPTLAIESGKTGIYMPKQNKLLK